MNRQLLVALHEPVVLQREEYAVEAQDYPSLYPNLIKKKPEDCQHLVHNLRLDYRNTCISTDYKLYAPGPLHQIHSQSQGGFACILGKCA